MNLYYTTRRHIMISEHSGSFGCTQGFYGHPSSRIQLIIMAGVSLSQSFIFCSSVDRLNIMELMRKDFSMILMAQCKGQMSN